MEEQPCGEHKVLLSQHESRLNKLDEILDKVIQTAGLDDFCIRCAPWLCRLFVKSYLVPPPKRVGFLTPHLAF